jgi:hypothetical protein
MRTILDPTAEDFEATRQTNIPARSRIVKAALPHLKSGWCLVGTTRRGRAIRLPAFNSTQTPGRRDELCEMPGGDARAEADSRQLPGPVSTPPQERGDAPPEYERSGTTVVLVRPGMGRTCVNLRTGCGRRWQLCDGGMFAMRAAEADGTRARCGPARS